MAKKGEVKFDPKLESELRFMNKAELIDVYNDLQVYLGEDVKKSPRMSVDELVEFVLAHQPKNRGRARGGVKEELRLRFLKVGEEAIEDDVASDLSITPEALRAVVSDLKNEKYANGPVVVLERDRSRGVLRRVA